MNPCAIERLIPARNPEETGTLLESFGAELGHLQKLAAVFKSSVFFPEGHNILRNLRRDAGHIGKQGKGSRVQVDPYRIDAGLDDSGQTFGKLLLVHVVLILADAHGLGVNLHELRQRVLQAAGDGSRRPLTDIEVGKLFRSQRRCAVDRSPGFAYDYIFQRLFPGPLGRFLLLFKEIGNDLLRLPGSSPVSNGKDRDVVLIYQTVKDDLGLFHLVLGGRRVDDCRIKNPSGRIDDGQLAAGTKGRVPAENCPAGKRLLHEELAGVFRENFDCPVLCLFRKVTADFPLDSRSNQPVIGVFYRTLQERRRIRIILLMNNIARDPFAGGFTVDGNLY